MKKLLIKIKKNLSLQSNILFGHIKNKEINKLELTKKILILILILISAYPFRHFYYNTVINNFFPLRVFIPFILLFIFLPSLDSDIKKIKLGEYLTIITIIFGIIFFIFQNHIETVKIKNDIKEQSNKQKLVENSFYCSLITNNLANINKATSTISLLAGFEEQRLLTQYYLTDFYIDNMQDIYFYLGQKDANTVSSALISMQSMNSFIEIVKNLDLTQSEEKTISGYLKTNSMIINRNKDIIEGSKNIFSALSFIFNKYNKKCLISS